VKILVTHPGRQHSHRAALALESAGMLAAYWSGVPAAAAETPGLPAFLRRRLAGYAPIALPPDRLRSFLPTPMLRRAGDALLPHAAAARLDYLACRLFDRWAAAGLPRIAAADLPRIAAAGQLGSAASSQPVLAGTSRPPSGGGAAAVIACEISALSTFRAARRRGLVTILDAPSIHHAAQDRLHGTTDPPALHRRILRLKDAEIALADHVLTVSELARDTYLAAGVAPAKVHAVPLGADLALFTPSPGGTAGERPFVFLFCGAAIPRKGYDLLLAAFAEVAAAAPGARLRTAGPLAAGAPPLAAAVAARLSHAGPLPQAALVRELQAADCLVLPSRNDSYAMVVPEALACGLPVLVSDMVGAATLVTPGASGWIVPAGDGPALAPRGRARHASGLPRRRRGRHLACLLPAAHRPAAPPAGGVSHPMSLHAAAPSPTAPLAPLHRAGPGRASGERRGR
jgi:glycosyltransferase involved in cell wall biosynthesis